MTTALLVIDVQTTLCVGQWAVHDAAGLIDPVEFDTPARLAPVQHGFSHYRLRLHPLHWPGLAPGRGVRDNDTLRWVARDDLATLGIPAPIRTLLLAPRVALED